MITDRQPTNGANSTCANCPYFQPFNEASGRGCCQLFEKVAKAHWKETQDCRNTAADLEAATAQPEQQPDEAVDAEVEYLMEIERKLEAYEQKQEEELIEVDSASGVYRVWKGMSLIGIFYRCLKTGLWVAEPRYVGKKRRYKTADQATNAIVRPYQRSTVGAAGAAVVKAWGMRHK